jgi:AcrR family transcriptional regulator
MVHKAERSLRFCVILLHVKTLRSDALRNHERLVASARELFARSGVDVPVEEITHHAGLGMGTLYRHFPTKEDLIDAVLEDAFAEIVAIAAQAAAEEDAWVGFTQFLEQALELHARNHGLKDILASREHGHVRATAMRRKLKPLLQQMIVRAREQGSLRPDFTPADLPLVFWTAGRVIETTGGVAPENWRRYLGFLLDGLRASAATPLPAPPLTQSQLDRMARREHAAKPEKKGDVQC